MRQRRACALELPQVTGSDRSSESEEVNEEGESVLVKYLRLDAPGSISMYYDQKVCAEGFITIKEL